MSKREFTAEDFASVKMPMTNGRIVKDIVILDDALRVINALLPEILAPYIEDLKAARAALDKIQAADTGTGTCVTAARAALAAQKVPL